MRYVHTEDDPIREAAETVASRRREIVQGAASAADADLLQRPPTDPATAAAAAAPRAIKTIVESRSASIGVGNYRPYRNRKGENRPAPPKPARRVAQLPDVRNDREGGAKVEGKIESRGTRWGICPGLHVGWRGTRPRGCGAAVVRKGRHGKGLARASYAATLSGWHHGRP